MSRNIPDALPGTSKQLVRLKVSALLTVTFAAQELEVVNGAGAAQGHWNYVVILKIEVAAALRAFPTVTLEDRTAHLARDGLPPASLSRNLAFLDVEQH